SADAHPRERTGSRASGGEGSRRSSGLGLLLAGARLCAARPARRGATVRRPRGRILAASAWVPGPCSASARRHRHSYRAIRSRARRSPLSPGAIPFLTPRHAPPHRPLPPRARKALPPHEQARAGPGTPHQRLGDVPRHGHDVLAGAGRDGRMRRYRLLALAVVLAALVGCAGQTPRVPPERHLLILSVDGLA